MTFKPFAVLSSLLTASLFVLPAASAESYTWTFASQDVSGSGSLTAVAYGSAGEYLITGGTGTVTDSTYGTINVVLPSCATPDAGCTLVNTDNAGANLTYDDLLFPDNAPGSELDGDGIVLTPGPAGTSAIGIFDMPSQEFYSYSTNGYQNLTTPFTVTPVNTSAVTPEPSSFALLGTGLIGMAGVLKRRFA